MWWAPHGYSDLGRLYTGIVVGVFEGFNPRTTGYSPAWRVRYHTLNGMVLSERKHEIFPLWTMTYEEFIKDLPKKYFEDELN